MLVDHKARTEGLDIRRSFIVQAPAGSGKTELLILRFLKLLLSVEQPEHILAITFTRKAASEMRSRIIDALISAGQNGSLRKLEETTQKEQRLIFARQVLKKDKKMNWEIIANPTRLRIQTIDSFCLYLANQLPILSRAGGSPQITSEVELCFGEAISNTLSYLESKDSISSDIENLLLHLDNDGTRLQKLLEDLLSRREQWLAYIIEINSTTHAKQYLNDCVLELIEESIVNLKTELTPFSIELEELVKYSTTRKENFSSDINEAIGLINRLPGTTIEDIPYWHWIIKLLLTDKGAWRRRITKTLGFPSGDKRKDDLKKLIEKMSSSGELNRLLNYIKILPTSLPDSQQWDLLNSLTNILLRLGTELIISFRNHGVVDYTQVSAAAKQALGSEGLPTDLTLMLDHKIRHILVDEFQDTSQLQLDLLKTLVGGWESADERSLFLVGDPMQSCYSFRNADVGIYLDVQAKGLPNLKIEPLQLKVNFRSSLGVIDWVNNHFETAFPSKSNFSIGAVPYSKAIPAKTSSLEDAVTTEIVTFSKDEKANARKAEALIVINTIKDLIKNSPSKSIAILIRNRKHLAWIIPELNRSKVNWESNEIDNMGELQIVEDLLNLTKALLNPHHKLSWLSLLRAPWVGLNISDLYTIAHNSIDQSVFDCLMESTPQYDLSEDGKKRLANFISCIRHSMNYRYQIPLVELIESTWRLLRGDAMVETEKERVSVRQYFDLLEKHSSSEGIADFSSFQEKIRNSLITFSAQRPEQSDSSTVQVLTIHKAKGLEFDHVIIPGLANASKNEDRSLLLWHERLNNSGEPRLLISPINSTGKEENDVYNLIKHEKKHKSLLEDTRLLYIAITRAKLSVKLIATVSLNTKKELVIPSNSLLARIWKEIQRESKGLVIFSCDDFFDSYSNQIFENSDAFPTPTPLRRFKNILGLTDSEKRNLKNKTLSEIDTADSTGINDEYAKSTLDAKIGELIHEVLEDYAMDGNKSVFLDKLPLRENHWKCQLQNHTTSDTSVNESIEFIFNSIKNCVTNSDLSWIFDESNNTSKSEHEISWSQNGKVRTYIIDRTLIDSDGVRWIIDFKTGMPQGESKEEFIRHQKELYKPQLQRYSDVFKKLEQRKTKKAILLTSITQLVTI